MVAMFDRDGIQFQYPENWRLTDEADASGFCVSVQSPESGFWMLQVFQTDQSPEQLIAEALQSIRQEYDSVDAVLVRQWIGQTETVGYDMTFYCLDFVVSARVRSFVVSGRACVTLCQAEDSEFQRNSPVFLAMTTSLIDRLQSSSRQL